MTTVMLEYCGVFADGDAGDMIEWEATIDGEDEAAYLRALEDEDLCLDDCEDLQPFLDAQRKLIAAHEIDNGTFDPEEMDIYVHFAEE